MRCVRPGAWTVRRHGRSSASSSLPHLKPFMQLCLLFGVIYILVEFDSIAMTTQGGPGDATMNLPYLIYRTLFYGYDVGHAAAMGVVLVVVTSSSRHTSSGSWAGSWRATRDDRAVPSQASLADPAHRARASLGRAILAWVIGIAVRLPGALHLGDRLQVRVRSRARCPRRSSPRPTATCPAPSQFTTENYSEVLAARLLAVLRALHHRGHGVQPAGARARTAMRLRPHLARYAKNNGACCSSSCPPSSCRPWA